MMVWFGGPFPSIFGISRLIFGINNFLKELTIDTEQTDKWTFGSRILRTRQRSLFTSKHKLFTDERKAILEAATKDLDDDFSPC